MTNAAAFGAAVAAVWAAYHDPDELIDHERPAREQPQALRDELRRRFVPG